MAEGKELIDANGNIITGNIPTIQGGSSRNFTKYSVNKYAPEPSKLSLDITVDKEFLLRENSFLTTRIPSSEFGTATAADVAKGKTFTAADGFKVEGIHECSDGVTLPTLNNPGTSSDLALGKQLIDGNGNIVEGTALIAGGNISYPDGAFVKATSFENGKQYALIALIDGNHRYINTTTYNDYTMNATQVTISEDTGDYIIFNNTPVLFTAVASGDGFLL